jgi:hypothetical protein
MRAPLYFMSGLRVYLHVQYSFQVIRVSYGFSGFFFCHQSEFPQKLTWVTGTLSIRRFHCFLWFFMVFWVIKPEKTKLPNCR